MFFGTHCKEMSVIPRISGVYFLVHVDRVVYVGMSRDVQRRINHHRYDGHLKFDRAFYIEVKARLRTRYEGAFIRYFDPDDGWSRCNGDEGRDAEILAKFGLTPNRIARDSWAAKRAQHVLDCRVARKAFNRRREKELRAYEAKAEAKEAAMASVIAAQAALTEGGLFF